MNHNPRLVTRDDFYYTVEKISKRDYICRVFRRTDSEPELIQAFGTYNATRRTVDNKTLTSNANAIINHAIADHNHRIGAISI